MVGSGWLAVLAFFEYSVLVVLAGLSIWSVALILDRRRYFNHRLKGVDFASVRGKIVEGQSLTGEGVFVDLVKALKGAGPETIDRVAKGFLTEERLGFEKGLSWLATLGSNAPFIGLFGTVLGIMAAFAALSGAGDAAVGAGGAVMTGISRSLIATAAGLFVAIPAVIAYNFFSRRMKDILSQCEALKEVFASRVLGATAVESNRGR